MAAKRAWFVLVCLSFLVVACGGPEVITIQAPEKPPDISRSSILPTPMESPITIAPQSPTIAPVTANPTDTVSSDANRVVFLPLIANRSHSVQTFEAGIKIVFARGPVDCAQLVTFDTTNNLETSFKWAGNNEEPAWSPDGEQFVASSGTCQGGDRSLIIFSQSTNQARVLIGSGNNIDPDWGSDGRIYFVQGNKSGNGELYSIRPDGGDLRDLGQTGRQPSLSPDGKHLAYMRLDNNIWRIWIAQFDRNGKLTQPQRLVLPVVRNGVHARIPGWTADGKRVIFTVANRQLESVGLGSVDLATQRASAWIDRSPFDSFFSRPACGQNNWCVAHEVTGGLWLLKDANGRYTIEGQLTYNDQDWGADIYP